MKQAETTSRYRLRHTIGRGGMGSVYLADDSNLRRRVAIKVLKHELVESAEAVQRFRIEAQTIAGLAHPNIAALYDYLEDPATGEMWMIMEYVAGPPLDWLLKDGNRLVPDVAVPLFCQILDAVGHAHASGVCHRDVKPANILLTEDGIPKLSDFGIAHVAGGDNLTRTGHAVGTVAYMAPEQIRSLAITERTDIYSLGVTLYHMLSGHLPFQGSSEFDIQQAHVSQEPPVLDGALGLPAALSDTIRRAMAKAPEDRFASASDFREALARTVPASAFAESGIRQHVQAIARRSLEPLEAGRQAPATGRPATRVVAVLAASIAIMLVVMVMIVGSKTNWFGRGRVSAAQLPRVMKAVEVPPSAQEIGPVAPSPTPPTQEIEVAGPAQAQALEPEPGKEAGTGTAAKAGIPKTTSALTTTTGTTPPRRPVARGNVTPQAEAERKRKEALDALNLPDPK